MSVSIKSPTSTTGSIQLNGSDVLTIDSSGNLTAPNNLTVTGTVTQTGNATFNGGISGNVNFDSGTLYVDATNNRVGIGTSSPANNLDVNGGARFATSQWVQFGTNNTFYADASYGLIVKAPATSNFIAFRDSSDTERMRIDSGGNVLISTTSTLGPSKLNIAYSGSTHWGITIRETGNVNNAAMLLFQNSSGSTIGSITNNNNTAIAYNTSSDYRLKENVAPMSGSIDRLKQLKPSTWTWIQNGSHGEGFVAHEAQTVVPEAVTGTKDAMRTEEYEVTPAVTDDEGNITTAAVMGTREVPEYQGIDQSKLVPLLTAAIQEQQVIIEDLETRIQALENPNG